MSVATGCRVRFRAPKPAVSTVPETGDYGRRKAAPVVAVTRTIRVRIEYHCTVNVTLVVCAPYSEENI
jgi:hypothetical protein